MEARLGPMRPADPIAAAIAQLRARLHSLRVTGLTDRDLGFALTHRSALVESRTVGLGPVGARIRRVTRVTGTHLELACPVRGTVGPLRANSPEREMTRLPWPGDSDLHGATGAIVASAGLAALSGREEARLTVAPGRTPLVGARLATAATTLEHETRKWFPCGRIPALVTLDGGEHLLETLGIELRARSAGHPIEPTCNLTEACLLRGQRVAFACRERLAETTTTLDGRTDRLRVTFSCVLGNGVAGLGSTHRKQS